MIDSSTDTEFEGFSAWDIVLFKSSTKGLTLCSLSCCVSDLGTFFGCHLHGLFQQVFESLACDIAGTDNKGSDDQ